MTTAAPSLRKVWTEQEIQALPDDGCNHEIVDGELVTSPKNNWQHGDICARLLSAMHAHVRAHRLGAVFDSSTGFWMANRNCRAPDIAFVARERLRGLDRRAPCFIQGAPDLAVEVVSPDLTRRELDARLRDFFASGTRLAWVIDPVRESAEVCHAPPRARPRHARRRGCPARLHLPHRRSLHGMGLVSGLPDTTHHGPPT